MPTTTNRCFVCGALHGTPHHPECGVELSNDSPAAGAAPVPQDTQGAPATHTPGPWQYYADLPSTEPNWHIVTNASRMRVIANIHIEPGNKTDEANARLIAAAPAVAEAAEAMMAALMLALPQAEGCAVNHYPGEPEYCEGEHIAKMRAAIALAQHAGIKVKE